MRKKNEEFETYVTIINEDRPRSMHKQTIDKCHSCKWQKKKNNWNKTQQLQKIITRLSHDTLYLSPLSFRDASRLKEMAKEKGTSQKENATASPWDMVETWNWYVFRGTARPIYRGSSNRNFKRDTRHRISRSSPKRRYGALCARYTGWLGRPCIKHTVLDLLVRKTSRNFYLYLYRKYKFNTIYTVYIYKKNCS